MKPFPETPIIKIEELYGREGEVSQLRRLVLEKKRWVAIIGPRAVGKTSLARAFATQYSSATGKPAVYSNFAGIHNFTEFVERFGLDVMNLVHENKLKLRRVSLGIKFFEAVLEREKNIPIAPRNPAALFDEVMRALPEGSLLVWDEIQDMRRERNKLLAALWRLHNVLAEKRPIIIFTGSAMGLFKKLLNPEYDDYLYGRAPVRVDVEPWDVQTGVEFLKRGLLAAGNVDFSIDELREASIKLGGFPGYLSSYGRGRIDGLTHRRALKNAHEEAVKRAMSELRSFVRLRPQREYQRKVIALLNAMGEGVSRPSSLARLSGLTEVSVVNTLETLLEMGIVEKESKSKVVSIYRFKYGFYQEAALRIRA
ncbi:AAA family ATPase [Thermococcus camini]|uniref:Putative Archaeal ATPase family protein n=1 Tax=Thermococcus camini TaxID=2016373 RepID=A0A7G2DAE4_9EURY|nr:ATP-binding protein [Thermococcus camini]CAD5244948.1 putative Archaeal ATPase family protein [Thermococcus camini]